MAQYSAGWIDGNIGEAAGLAVFLPTRSLKSGGRGCRNPARPSQLQTVFGRGIAQVIRQQRVHHHAAENQAMPQQDQAVVFGVLQRLWDGWGCSARGRGLQHGFTAASGSWVSAGSVCPRGM